MAHRLPVRKVVVAASQAVAGEGKYQCGAHGVVDPGPRPIEQLERGDWETHCPYCDAYVTPLPIDEATSNPHTAYGISKYAVEMLALRLGGPADRGRLSEIFPPSAIALTAGERSESQAPALMLC